MVFEGGFVCCFSSYFSLSVWRNKREVFGEGGRCIVGVICEEWGLGFAQNEEYIVSALG